MLRFIYKKDNKDNVLTIKENEKKNLRFYFVSKNTNGVGIDENDERIKKITFKKYEDILNILRREYRFQFEKLFYNLITEDGKYFTIIRKSPKGGEMLFLYEFENDSIRDLFEGILGGKSSAVFGGFENSYIWCMTADLLETLITAEILKDNNIPLYDERHKRKKNGKIRTYYAPNEDLKECLRSLNTLFQLVYDNKNIEFQVAYKKGKSVYNNAEIHKENQYVYNLDLKDFYPSCKRDLVRKYVEFLFNSVPGKEFAIEKFLDIITINDGLFIGSPVSGCLANTILSQPVRYIKNMCEQEDMKFSIYADDMTFSGNKKIKRKKAIGLFNEAFTTYGLDSYFSLNDEKAVGYSGMNRKITGVSINENNQLTIKRRYYRDIRSMINHLSNDEDPEESVNINKLRGKIAYGLMVDDSGKFYNYLLKFMPTVKKYNLCSDEKLEELKEKFNTL